MIFLVAGVSLGIGYAIGQFTIWLELRKRYQVPHELTFWDWLDKKLA